MEDLIRRQETIDALTEYLFNTVTLFNGMAGLTMEDCRDAACIVINRLPSAQQWIPASERLPNYGEDVLLTDGHDYAIGFMFVRTERVWRVHDYNHPLKSWTAWMPLPPEYKEETNESK